MTLDEFHAQLESELGWRSRELAFFKNQMNYIPLESYRKALEDSKKAEEDKKEAEKYYREAQQRYETTDEYYKEAQERYRKTEEEYEAALERCWDPLAHYRKSLVLMLYSHMEGYVKIALQTYVQYLNALHLLRKDVPSGLAAASMDQVFKAYENLDRKSDVFRRELPEDTALHRFYRRVDFLEQMEEFQAEILSIEDSAIDTESNLWYIVLQKNLYKIGLPVDLFETYRKDIDALVNRRNTIAHGDFRSGVSEQEFSNWESKISRIMTDIKILLFDYAKNQRYLRNPPE